MTTKKTTGKNPFPGFSEKDFEPINIKSVHKQKGKYTIEIAPKVEKQKEAKYHYEFSDGIYLIKEKNKQLETPGGIPVTTNSESLAIKAIEHLVTYGEEYTMAYSIICFLYSNIDFFETKPREELEGYILNDLETDWTFKSRYIGKRSNEKYNQLYSDYHLCEAEFKEWLKGLNKTQVGGVVVMGASLESVNTAFILSNNQNLVNEPEFTEYYDKCYHQYYKKKGGGMYGYYSLEQAQQIFENYLFWQSLKT